jgi:hypothetical protein
MLVWVICVGTTEAVLLPDFNHGGSGYFIPPANNLFSEKTTSLELTQDEFLAYQKERIPANRFLGELMKRKTQIFGDRNLYRESILKTPGGNRKVGFLLDSRMGQNVGAGSLGLSMIAVTSAIQLGYLGPEWKERIYRMLLALHTIQELQPKGKWLDVFKIIPLPLVRGIVEVVSSLKSEQEKETFIKDENRFKQIIQLVGRAQGWDEGVVSSLQVKLSDENMRRETVELLWNPRVTLEEVQRVADYGMEGKVPHFITLEGERAGVYVEDSSIDSVFWIVGGRPPATAFPDFKPAGEQFTMKELADKVFDNFNADSWTFFDPNDKKGNHYLHGWRPNIYFDTPFKNGKINPEYSYFGDERLILEIFRVAWLLRKGRRPHPGIDFLDGNGLSRVVMPVMEGAPSLNHYASVSGAAWTYQYGHLLYRFFKNDKQREFLRPGQQQPREVNWYKNTVNALLGIVDYAMHKGDEKRGDYFFGGQNYKGYYPYDALVTTTDVPRNPQGTVGGFQMDHGTPLGWVYRGGGKPMNDGTFTPSGFAASLPFVPLRSFQTLKYHYMTSLPLTQNGRNIYFFAESMNRRMDWFSVNNNMLNESIFYMGLVNTFHDGKIWETFEQDEITSKALDYFGIKGDVSLALPELNPRALENASTALERNRNYASAEAAVKELYKLAEAMNSYNDRRVLTLFSHFFRYTDRITQVAYDVLVNLAKQSQGADKVKALALQFVVAKNNVWIADQVRIFRDELIPLLAKNPQLMGLARDIIYNYDYEFRIIAGKYKVAGDKLIPEYGLFGPEEMAKNTIERALKGEGFGARVYYPDIFTAR